MKNDEFHGFKKSVQMYIKCLDGNFRLFLAQYGSWAGDKQILFRVRIDRDPKVRAKEKGINYYDRLIDVTSNIELVKFYMNNKKFDFTLID